MQSSMDVNGGMRPPSGGAHSLSSVHADMEEIFAGVAGTTPAPRMAAKDIKQGQGSSFPAFRHNRGLWTICVVALLLLAGGMLAQMRSNRSRAAEAARAPMRTEPARIAQAPAAARTSSSSVDTSRTTAGIDAPRPQIPQAPAMKMATRTPVADSRKSADLASKPSTDVEAPPLTSRQHGSEQPQTHPAPDAETACSPPYEAWCLREATLAADHALRDAYSDAVRAGVASTTLATIKRDWVRYRREAQNQPRQLIRGYTTLTDKLRSISGADAKTKKAEHR